MTIRELVTKLGFQIDDGTIKKYEKKVDDVKKKSEQLSNAVSGIGRAISVIGGAVAAAGFGALGKSILETTGEVEQYRVTLGTMIGDQAKANQIIHDLDYSPVSDFYGTAAAIGGLQGMVTFGMQAEEASDILTRLGDIAQGNGEAFQSLSLNMGQVFAKGKADATDLKQFVGQGFDVVGEVAKITGQSRAEIEKAGVSYEMCATALTHITSEGGKYEGMLKKQSNTLPGLVKQFQSLTAAIQESIGSAVLDKVKDLMQHILDLGRAMQDNIVAVGQKVFETFLKGIANVKIFLDMLMIEMEEFGGAFTPIKAIIKDTFSLFGSIIQSSVPFFLELSKAILLSFKPIQAFVSPVLESLKPLFAEVFGLGADVIRELLPIINSLTPAFEYFGNTVSTIISKITPIFKNVARAITAMIQPIYSLVAPAIAALEPLFTAVFGVIYDGLDSAGKATGTFAAIIEGITPIFSVLGKIIGGVVSVFANGLAVILPQLEPIASKLIKITSVILGVIAAIKIWTAVQAALNAIIAMNPLGLIVIGIVGVIGAIALLKKNWESVKPIFEKVCNAIKGFFVALAKAVAMSAAVILAVMFPIPALIISGLALIAKNWEKVKSAIIKSANAIGSFFANLWSGIVETAKKAFENIKKAWSGIKGFFSKLWTGIVSSVKSAWSGVVEFFKRIVEGIKTAFNAIVGFYKKLFEVEVNAIKAVWNGIVAFFETIVEGIKSAFNAIGSFFANLWSGIVENTRSIINGIADAFSAVLEKIKGVWSGITEFFGTLWTSLKESPLEAIKFIENAFLGMLDKIKENFFGVIDKIKEGWENIKGFFGDVWEGAKELFTGNSPEEKGKSPKASGKSPKEKDTFPKASGNSPKEKGSNPRAVNDMILTPEGTFSTHPDDVIFAMKEPYSLFEKLAELFVASAPREPMLSGNAAAQSVRQSIANDYSSHSSNVQYNTPIRVTVNASGMTTEQARRAVESGVRGALKDAIRGSRGVVGMAEAV